MHPPDANKSVTSRLPPTATATPPNTVNAIPACRMLSCASEGISLDGGFDAACRSANPAMNNPTPKLCITPSNASTAILDLLSDELNPPMPIAAQRNGPTPGIMSVAAAWLFGARIVSALAISDGTHIAANVEAPPTTSPKVGVVSTRTPVGAAPETESGAPTRRRSADSLGGVWSRGWEVTEVGSCADCADASELIAPSAPITDTNTLAVRMVSRENTAR